MIYKTYKCNSYNIHTIKTDKFKTCHMEIIFTKEAKKEELASYSFLVDLISETSNLYKSRKEVVIHLEELYKTVFYGLTTKLGKMLSSSFILDFIDPCYIDEPDYLENVLKFPFDMLQNPHVTNDEFDLKTFNIIKKRMEREITGLYENPTKIAFREAFNTLDKESPTSFPLLGTLEDLEKITPSSLYKIYLSLMKDNLCDIFIIGNLDMDEVVTQIKKNFQNRIISNQKRELYVENASRKKELMQENKANFIQANLVLLFNTENLTKKEKDIVFHVYNYILGSGGLTSKLYQSIREENSLCYGISSMYLKYDSLLAIHVSLDNENIKKAISLIKNCLKKMAKGDMTETEIEDAKRNISLSLDLSLDNEVAILNNHVFNIFDDLPPLEDRKKQINEVTKKEIVEVAKKVKINTTYVLKGGKG